MVESVLCKICDIRDVHTARVCAQLGADFLGIHAIAEMTPERELLCRRVVKELNEYYPAVRVALVTKVLDPLSLARMIQRSGVSHVQLHALWDAGRIRDLKERLAALGRADTGIIAVVDPHMDRAAEHVSALAPLVDFLLFDHLRGGTGRLLAPPDIQKAWAARGTTPAFLAGGLTADNVASLVSKFRPEGVDVKTGTEFPDRKHVKDPARIAQFLTRARGTVPSTMGLGFTLPRGYPAVSIALTDVEPAFLENPDILNTTDIDLVHLDHADATLAPDFVADSLDTAEALRKSFPVWPYDLHVFSDPLSRIPAIVAEYVSRNPALRALHVHNSAFEESSVLPLVRRLETLEQLGTCLVLALSARHTDQAALSRNLPRLMEAGVTEVSVVAPANRAPRPGAAVDRRSLVARLNTLRVDLHLDFALGVDRDVSPQTLRGLSRFGIRRVVSGHYLTCQRRLQAGVDALRTGMAAPAPAGDSYE